jgi:hypothetical protein
MWKEATHSPTEILSRHLAGETEENKEVRTDGVLTDIRTGHLPNKAGSLLASCWFPAWLILRHVLAKRRLTFNGIYGVISQETEFFVSVFVR